MEYRFQEIEKKWQQRWKEAGTYRIAEDPAKPKYYVLDMFPYPSGAGLHVGHPLGYIASDIFSRYKRMQGFCVLHPMGYDAFGLPAEQYAIQTGQHPAVTTENNIRRYRQQMDMLGFSFDWDREVRTCDPSYYKWTQWIFLQLFNHWFDKKSGQAQPISALTDAFQKNGNQTIDAATGFKETFTAEDWNGWDETEQEKILQHYRLAFRSEAVVNWCPALGTVLANDEVKDGLSERGGHPVVQKKMKQWSLRITAYAERLLQGLDQVDWSDALKEMQRNWIGKSHGADISFQVDGSDARIKVFTTRPDTIFGASFMVLAPEHPLVDEITTADQKAAIEAYKEKTSRKSERERQADVKSVTGCFTGAYAINPFNNEQIPVWIADYVLAGYGTGAIMAVPSGDERDWRFAKQFGLKIVPVIEGQDAEQCAEASKDAMLTNSDFLNGMRVPEAIKAAIKKIEELGIGHGTVNYKLRDAVFGRQRYWGEPIPVFYKNGVPHTVEENELPVLLPEIDKYQPTEDGDAPLARAKNWKYRNEFEYEHTTMPGWAGSSWYWLRYMDPKNENEPFAKDKEKYWQQVDLYIGGSEHATGHLLYSRFWNQFMFDLGMVSHKEPFKKLVNQGMILGMAHLVYFDPHTRKAYSSDIREKLSDDVSLVPTYALIDLVDQERLDVEGFKKWKPDFSDYTFEFNDQGLFMCEAVVEKMSKSKFNVVSPDTNPETGKEGIVERYGTDTLRLYEMFLGPLTIAKPWDTHGIEGTFRFLKKVWGLFYDKEGNWLVQDSPANPKELKALHKTIKKIGDDIERLSMNTAVSQFMICINELSDLKCHNREVLESFVLLLAPFAPHICEELWEALGHKESITTGTFPEYNEDYLQEDTVMYPVSFNGKTRFTVELPAALGPAEIEKEVLAMEHSAKWLDGKKPKKVIVVPGRIVNVVM
ncbi:MAG: leucine--tRNA ligase [Flavobacteriales bacterium]|nr:leucine--tRNA ligase [Flavobacteriales bacterium]MCB9449691.1 leucine--tRNA ligase [Flavobacteriales bacterium]